MFYNLLYPLSDSFSAFNLFQYITVRAGGALGTSFILSLIFAPMIIRKFREIQKSKVTVRTDHPENTVTSKAGTPSMGGLIIIGTLLASVFLWADLTSYYVWLLIAVSVLFCLVGFADDYYSMTQKWKKGVPGRIRLLIQTAVSCGVIYYIVEHGNANATLVHLPFVKDAIFEIGIIGALVFGSFIIVGTANAVNLTDGLDGLVSVPALVVAGVLALVAYITGRTDFSEYLNIPYISGAGEVSVFCAALVGSLLGFLWFNAPPARIFMGDTGALPVGAILGTVSVIIKQEFMLGIIGGIFVLETVSVIIQVTSFKLTGKRVFKMAPLHHHFEHKGWAESTIVVRFWIVSIILAFVGLAMLKLR